MHLLWGRVHCWQIVFWNSWVSLTLDLRHHFLHCLVSCVYQPECVIHYVINDTTVLIYYEILLRLQTGEAITVSVMMGPQVIGVFVDDYQLFCYDAPPHPFWGTGRYWHIALLVSVTSVSRSLFPVHFLRRGNAPTRNQIWYTDLSYIRYLGEVWFWVRSKNCWQNYVL